MTRTSRTNRTGRECRSTNRREETAEDGNPRRDLERRVDRLETEVAWLAHVVRDARERDDALATGPCPNCSRGVLVRRNGELRCASCGYARFL